MYSRIMVPVDLAHQDAVTKAMDQAADLSKLYDAPVSVVGVTVSQPTAVARSPDEYAEKLKAFVEDHAQRTGARLEAHPVVSHDPAVDLDDLLREQAESMGADLVVMASHIPRFSDMVFGSHADSFVRHSDVSVFVVR
ncbi:universal stress protein [Roseospira marina]|uniref:Universal stress protein n=1 Tax=Roseospira marina TaxID=140057 RepID=A0A5M6IBW1_9PROT|nr:universal stress protein [Roseospira marina]KAA5605602.1 universal stress protein [Roseospira marina]MBB4313330.1 nucleotide-binding universal stress UspA family protein [Roseospira marina]MBB5085929.1 nucleotide-binding universal stress UspA family protein [Roseospira marina]